MTREEQLDLWLDGKSVHNDDANFDESGCCPDFSCCKPELLVSIEDRELFVDAFNARNCAVVREMLLRFFLCRV